MATFVSRQWATHQTRPLFRTDLREFFYKQDCFILLFERDCLLSNKETVMTRLLSRVVYVRLIEQIPTFWTNLVSFGRIEGFSVNKTDSSYY